MSDYDEQMWTDYDYFQNTGEPEGYFDEGDYEGDNGFNDEDDNEDTDDKSQEYIVEQHQNQIQNQSDNGGCGIFFLIIQLIGYVAIIGFVFYIVFLALFY